MILGVLVASWLAAGSGDAVGSPCADRYVLLRSQSDLGRPGDILVVDATGAVLDPACGAAPVRPRRSRGHWRLRARWDQCGTTKALRLTLRASRDCTLQRGTLGARGRAPRPIVAVVSSCGDGFVDRGRGERCDDGNLEPGDACDPTCGRCTDPTTLESTWAAIRATVLDRHCLGCHGANASGGLDLRGDGAYARIVGVPVPDVPGFVQVAPGDRQASYLWLKLAKGTVGGLDGLPGAGMPIGPELSVEVLEAVGRWIDAGAPAAGIVPTTEALFAGCQ